MVISSQKIMKNELTRSNNKDYFSFNQNCKYIFIFQAKNDEKYGCDMSVKIEYKYTR